MWFRRMALCGFIFLALTAFFLGGCLELPSVPSSQGGTVVQLEESDEDVEIYEEEDTSEEEFELVEEEADVFRDSNLGNVAFTVTVKNTVTKEPIQDAKVTLKGKEGEYPGSTGENGQCTLPNVPIGKYRLTVTKEWYRDFSKTVNIKASTKGIKVYLKSTLATLKGKAIDKVTKKSIAGVNVTLEEDTSFSATTDSKGWFSISDIPPGRYTMVASRKGYQEFRKSITLRAMKKTTVNFKMQRGSVGTAKWTVMVYMAADNNFSPFSREDVEELKQVGSTEDVNIILFWDPGRAQAGYYYVGSNKGDLELLQSLKNVNSTSPAALREFVRFATSRYPANHYVLIMWGHGAGWREGRGIAFYDSSSSSGFMSIPEFAQALSGFRFDLIGFDSCLMAMVEVAYEIRNLAQVMVAAESVEYYPGGWDYTVLSELTSNPDLSARELAQEIVDSAFDAQSAAGDVVLSAVDLSRIGALVTALNNVAQTQSSLSLASPSQILSPQSPWIYDEFGYRYGSLDIGNFADAMENTALRNVLTQAVFYNRACGIHENASGLAVYLPHPNHRSQWPDWKSLYQSLAFAKNTSWDDLINRWYSQP